MKFNVELDTDAEAFFEEILDDMVTRFSLSEEDALKKINNRTRMAGPIKGNHMLYHASVEYWSQSFYWGHRDWWRDGFQGNVK